MLSDQQQRFLNRHRVGRLATASAAGKPHVVPVCFILADTTVYITIDEKPKRDAGKPLQRIRNIGANPFVALVVDHYEEDWSRLGWIMLRGPARMLASGPEHDHAQRLLRARYPQYGSMRIEHLPVIAIRVERVNAWGRLEC